ncbi:flavodoxin family protein [Methanosarcina mazei]|uniref:FMN reductase n=1 Tax=Methanosarcina mazei TaxID=2209 RepID=A0A0F8G662_METMZ|nr:flavodoxin family protein [Methanosarcina mazei]KKG53995.1 FMN reductase [Methanosarcina mazei]KKG60011.1 FMN reductase [Methanosarcina mazei]KKG65976.1 FMN reductase [Methanosarcina mazei]KKH00538.1 FMN reductase [Methanosarcina mazei]KKH01215.1 FMN reductase [Methanosarcina mazei]
MKVLGINGSARKDGNTAILIQTVFDELTKEGIETELIQLSENRIEGCKACRSCHKKKDKQCVITDDFFNECLAKMIASDGIILGSPVYSAGVTSQMKALIDRASMVLAGNKGLLKHKVGASVIAACRGGAISAFDTLNNFLYSKEMILTGSSYWNMVYGNAIGEVEQDKEGIENLKNLGQNMAWILKKIHSS